MKLTRRAATPVVLASTLALTLAACASDRDATTSSTSSGSSAGSGTTAETFTFGAAGAPEVFDPFYASDGETFRVTRQMMQGLLGIKAGSAEAEPELAESWEPSADGLSWTFKLRQGVTFTDGEKFDAAAVCYNFDRMYAQNEAAAWGPPNTGPTSWATSRAAPTPRSLRAARSRTRRPDPGNLRLPGAAQPRLVLHAVAEGTQGRRREQCRHRR